MNKRFITIPILFDTKESLEFDKQVKSINEIMNKEDWNYDDILESLKLSIVKDGVFYNIDNITPYMEHPMFNDYSCVRSGGFNFIVNLSFSDLLEYLNK